MQSEYKEKQEDAKGKLQSDIYIVLIYWAKNISPYNVL